jgi:hypothetical protein
VPSSLSYGKAGTMGERSEQVSEALPRPLAGHAECFADARPSDRLRELDFSAAGGAVAVGHVVGATARLPVRATVDDGGVDENVDVLTRSAQFDESFERVSGPALVIQYAGASVECGNGVHVKLTLQDLSSSLYTPGLLREAGRRG